MVVVDSILAVGPRELPPSGMVMVWVDSGNTTGHQVPVPLGELRVAELDDGQARRRSTPCGCASAGGRRMSWLSGPCDDDGDQPLMVVFEHRPPGSTLPEVEVDEETGVVWVDAGSGPGWTEHRCGEMPSDHG